MLRIAMIVSVLALSATQIEAQEWTRFRGPNGTGVSAVKGLPTSWTEKDFEWSVKLPGRGHSSPVVWGEKIFVTSVGGQNARQVSCVDAKTGALVWTKDFDGAKYKMHARNTAASSTPTVDAERVYLLWGTPKETIVQAITHSGEPAWKVDLGPYHGEHGIGVSPILHGDLLIVPNDQDKKGELVALDTKTGERRWTIPRISGNATYATPCVYTAGDQPRLVFTNWKHGVTGVDPKSGKIAWEKQVFDPTRPERSIVSPILAGDLIVGTCSFTTAQKHFVAVQPQADGTLKEIWRVEKSVSHIPTPIAVGDHIYIVTEKGIASCLDAKTGQLVWQERLDNEFAASPVCADGVIYAAANNGDVYVFKASPVFTLLSRSPLGDPCQATPAIAGDRILFRTENNLMSLKARR